MRKFVPNLLVAAASLVPVAAALGHGVIVRDGEVIHYTAFDPLAAATVTISSTEAGTVQFRDTTSPGGMDWGPCLPLNEKKSRCETNGVSRIDVQVFDAGDSVKAQMAVPLDVAGGSGNDSLTGGFGADAIAGGSGDDSIGGGLGADTVSGAEGNDLIDVRDGIPDSVSCGDGADTLIADETDPVQEAAALGCESIEVAPAPPDTVAPEIELGPEEKLAISKSGALPVPAALSEPGALSLGGRLLIDGEDAGKLGEASAAPDSPGQFWTMRAELPAKLEKKARKAIERRKPVAAKLELSGADAAGNVSSLGDRVKVAGK